MGRTGNRFPSGEQRPHGTRATPNPVGSTPGRTGTGQHRRSAGTATRSLISPSSAPVLAGPRRPGRRRRGPRPPPPLASPRLRAAVVGWYWPRPSRHPYDLFAYRQVYLHGDCTGTARGLHRDCPGTAQGLHRDCTGTAQGLHRACTGTAQGLHRDCTGTAQGLHGSAAGEKRWLPAAEPSRDVTRLQQIEIGHRRRPRGYTSVTSWCARRCAVVSPSRVSPPARAAAVVVPAV
ncbi:hypothetical protein ONE63_010851 [Megalurothrips usitatus]|uniref:Uncharacterized protein n=1 Tax=Megalurothrips usitatus TaxID=439358 RepID=A0AAV7XL59_9NEOP|nr:hypothetical protein ONE63_010851 [Megalurothrips usitatus]